MFRETSLEGRVNIFLFLASFFFHTPTFDKVESNRTDMGTTLAHNISFIFFAIIYLQNAFIGSKARVHILAGIVKF